MRYVIMCNKFNKKIVKQIVRPFDIIYHWMEGHIIFVKSKGNVFNNSTLFNINAHSCNGDVLMNLNILYAWCHMINNNIYVTNCANIC